jgi:hypothetical protein
VIIDTNTFFVDAPNNSVGIGTLTPTRKLHVNGSARFDMSAGTVRISEQQSKVSVQATNSAESGFADLKLDGSNIIFNTQSSGNVGIRTNSPVAPLHIEGDTYTAGTFYGGRNEGAIDDLTRYGLLGTGSANFYNTYTSGNGDQAGLGFIQGQFINSPVIYMYGTNNTHNNAFNVGTLSSTGANPGSNAFSSKLMVRHDGNVGINTTSPLDKLTVRSTDSNLHSTTLTKGSNTKGVWVITSNNDDDMMGIHMGAGGGTHFASIVGARTANASHWGTHLSFYTHGDNTSALNTATERMRITGDGEITMPYQPVCSTTHNSAVNLSNVILTSANFYDTIHVNRGGHFNSSNGRFTCPVGGVYRIYFRATGTGNSNVRLRKNGSTVNEAYEATGTNHSVSSEAIVNCAAGDYLEIQVANLQALGGTQHKQVTFEFLG